MTDISTADSAKTRVLLFSANRQISALVKYVLQFHGKNADFSSKATNSEFFIKESVDLESAIAFKPNIAFVLTQVTDSEVSQIAHHLTGGGVLIFPAKYGDTVSAASNYFRTIPYEEVKGVKSGTSFAISTEMGDLPLQFNDEDLVSHIQGIQLLLQQFVIMEEDFYEALLTFKL